MRSVWTPAALLACVLLVSGSLNAQTVPETAETPAPETVIDQTPDQVIYLDAQKKIRVDLTARTLTIPAEVNQAGGIIELVLGSTFAPDCRSHESSFITSCRPSLIHAGLQLIGINPGRSVAFNGQEALPEGDGVRIDVVWNVDDREYRVRLEKLIYNRLTEEPLIDFDWVFTGSRMITTRDEREVYESDLEGTIIATWHCTSTVIDIPLPEGSDDTVFFSHKPAMPALHTPVLFVFTPAVPSATEPTGSTEPVPAEDAAP